MHRPAGTAIAIVVALTALAGVAGCSSTPDAAAPATTQAAPPTTQVAGGSGGDGGSGESKDEATDCEADQQAGSDQELLSRSVRVMWTVDSKSTEATADATANTTLTFQSDGTLDRSELTVGVNEVFAVIGDDQVRAVVVGCADGQTVFGPAPVGFYITQTGTYDVLEEISDAKLATITVK